MAAMHSRQITDKGWIKIAQNDIFRHIYECLHVVVKKGWMDKIWRVNGWKKNSRTSLKMTRLYKLNTLVGSS